MRRVFGADSTWMQRMGCGLLLGWAESQLAILERSRATVCANGSPEGLDCHHLKANFKRTGSCQFTAPQVF